MTDALFLVEALPTGNALVLDGDEGRHAATVKRVRVGEHLLIGDGRGNVATAIVTATGRTSVELEIFAREFTPVPAPRLVVVQALPKGDRAELAVELLTELGVDEIVPWASARAVTRWEPDRAVKSQARWQRTAREAAKQSRRPWIPSISALASTVEVTGRLRAAGTALVLHEAAESGLATAESGLAAGLAGAAEVIVVVGPEGGIAPEELAAFTAAGATPVRLGSAVLCTSTAGGAALVALNVALGRWR